MSPSGPLDPRMQHARLEALTKPLPAILIFSFVDAVLLVAYFWPEVDSRFLVGWLVLMGVHSVFWGLALAYHWLKPAWILGLSLAEAVLFSAFLVVVFPLAGPGKSVLLAAFAMGLLAAGGLSKMSMPVPAVAFLVAFALGTGLGVARSGLPSLWLAEGFLGAFALALSVLVTTMSKVFDARILAEEELDRQKTLVSHLLTDFEESASEGLWETDAEGRLTSVSPRLAQVLATPASVLEQKLLIPREQAAEALGRGQPFRNLIVPFESDDGRRWWSLTGKPLKDATGRITGWRGVCSDVTSSRQRELEMLRLSRHDALTGLLNRHAFRSLLDDLLSPGMPEVQRCLALVDIVEFRDVNEARGHAFGDSLLQSVAGRLKQSVSQAVLVARLDGDEFALLLPVSRSTKDTRRELERLLENLKEPYRPLSERFEAGFRLGLSFSPQDATTADQWLKCADLALRSAKNLGRNSLAVFSPQMLESFRTRNSLREDLKGAIGRGELWVAYQPIVDLQRNRITSFEALVRWNHPTRGPIPPADFIPLAEDNEVIFTLGLWVLSQACQEAKSWPTDIHVAVNVSGVQLRMPSLAENVVSVLAHLGFDPRRLVLEITESALVHNDKQVGANLSALRTRGVRLALDDFGTGYSALAYLQNFPFDKLKIDQTFVRSGHSGTPSAPLLAAIVKLSEALSLTTTAEGIEDPLHLEYLKALGCQEGQGYLFSKPVPPDQIPQLLAAQFSFS